MDRVRYWGPRLAGKYWGPVSAGLAVGELMYDDAYRRVSDWAASRGMKRKSPGDNFYRPVPRQDTLKLPALQADSNNKMPMSSGASMRSSRSRRSRSSMRSRGRRARRFMRGQIQTSGHYTGPFKFPSKKPTATKDPVAVRGSRGQIEQNIEACEANHIAYVGFSSFPRTMSDSVSTWYASPMYHLAACLVRAMFKKFYMIDFARHDSTIASEGVSANVNGTLHVYYKREPVSAGTTGYTNVPEVLSETITFTNTNTLKDIAAALATKLCGSNYGARGYVATSTVVGVTAVTVPYRHTFYGLAFADTTFGNRGLMCLEDRYVKIKTKQVIYVQNQTKSDGDSLSVDVIDSNPIHGKIFYFKDPNPEVRYDKFGGNPGSYTGVEYALMHDTNADGVIYPNVDIVPAGVDGNPWNQMPKGDYFRNCSRYSNVALAPGEMKKLTFSFKFDGKIQKFIEGLDLGNTSMVGGTSDNPSIYQTMRSTSALGTSVLFAFEKRLSTGTGKVEVAVQRNLWTSCILGGKGKRTLMPATVAEVPVIKDDTTTAA